MLNISEWPQWAVMWAIAVVIFVGCKVLTWSSTDVQGVAWWRHLAYLFAWPGLDAKRFLGSAYLSRTQRPQLGEWGQALLKLSLGITIFWGIGGVVPSEWVLVRGWVGMVGLVMMLHFGSFHLLSCFWRTLGIDARPLMNNPLAASSVSDFWGRRWNIAFRDLTHRFLFQPLRMRFGVVGGLVAGFIFSGIIHDLVISLPAGGGYGWPTLFFVVQVAAMIFERSNLGKGIGLGAGWRGWFFTMLVLATPLFGLFHPPFVRMIIVPFMDVLGVGLWPIDLLGGSMISDFMKSDLLPINLTTLIYLAGLGQLSVLIASAITPFQLRWTSELSVLSRLHRQMYWVYAAYVVLAIVAFAALSLSNAGELASGSLLARGVCAYIAIFWGVRIALQGVFDVKEHLRTWWLKLGYHLLTVLFVGFTVVYGVAALRPF